MAESGAYRDEVDILVGFDLHVDEEGRPRVLMLNTQFSKSSGSTEVRKQDKSWSSAYHGAATSRLDMSLSLGSNPYPIQASGLDNGFWIDRRA